MERLCQRTAQEQQYTNTSPRNSSSPAPEWDISGPCRRWGGPFRPPSCYLPNYLTDSRSEKLCLISPGLNFVNILQNYLKAIDDVTGWIKSQAFNYLPSLTSPSKAATSDWVKAGETAWIVSEILQVTSQALVALVSVQGHPRSQVKKMSF